MANRVSRRNRGEKPFNGPAMAVKEEQVFVEFPVKVKWFSMGLDEAEDFIARLKVQVNKLKGA